MQWNVGGKIQTIFPPTNNDYFLYLPPPATLHDNSLPFHRDNVQTFTSYCSNKVIPNNLHKLHDYSNLPVH